MKKYASSLAAAAVGVVLLAVLAGFAILLPNAGGGSSSSDSQTSLPRLPATVGDLVALDSDQVPAALQQQIGGSSRITSAQDQGGKGLEKVYGARAAYKFYGTTDGQSLAAVMVLDKAPGLFSPDGPPAPTTGDQQPAYQLSRVSGAVCATYYGQQQGSTGQPSGAVQLSRAHCQLGSGGRTYDIDARGLSVAKTVAALKELATA